MVLLLAACGERAGAPAPLRTPVERQLRLAGYTMRHDVVAPRWPPAPVAAFSVPEIDWTTPHTFSASVYVFASGAGARAFGTHVRGLLTRYAKTFRDASRTVRFEVSGATAVLAFTEMSSPLCTYLGLCDSYSQYGAVTYRGTPPDLQCSKPALVPAPDFARLVSVARTR